MKKLLVLASIVFAYSATASTEPSSSAGDSTPLESQLQGLELPGNQAPFGVTGEKLYSVQNRFSSLKYRSEAYLGTAYNFMGNGYMTMTQADLGYRFHFSDRWSLGVQGSYAFNSLNKSGDLLLKEQGLLPDAAYVKSRASLLLGYNTFYGKLRFSMDSVTYFDQYVAVGPGVVNLDTGKANSFVADVGFVFWMKKMGSLRIGLQNEIYRESRGAATGTVYDMLGHLDLGLLFGGTRE